MTDFLAYLQQSAFSTWVRESGSLYSFPGILLLHTYGMAIVVGIVAAIDLRILGFAPALPLGPIAKFLPLVWGAFLVNAITGTILLVADASTWLHNWDFGVKMLFIALAVLNQFAIQKRVLGDERLDKGPFSMHAKMLAGASLVCWIGAITAGRLLAYVGGNGLK